MSSRLPILAGLVVAAAAAGCLAEDAPVESSSLTNMTPPRENLTAALPFHAEGTYWVESSQGFEPTETAFEIPVNASGMGAMIMLDTGFRFGPADAPTFHPQVTAQLLDPEGEVLAEASNNGFLPETIHLEASDLEEGLHSLVLSIYGGSDGEANGQFVAYVIDVE